MALRKEKVENFRLQLVHRRDSIAADLRLATADLINDAAVYTDAVDQAAADTEKNFSLQLRNRERLTLARLAACVRRSSGG